MHRIRWARAIAVVAIVSAALCVALVGQASAQQQSVNFDGPVTAGQTLTLTCPDGYQLQNVDGRYQASATFYRTSRKSKILAGPVGPNNFISDPTGTYIIGASWQVPKGAKWATASATCEPIPPPTVSLVQAVTLLPETSTVVSCPSGYVVDPATVTATYPLTWTVQGGDITVTNGSLAIAEGEVSATCNLA